MSAVLIPRSVRHPNAAGKSLEPTLAVGTRVVVSASYGGIVARIRRKKKYARRYLVANALDGFTRVEWLRRDQLTVGAAHGQDVMVAGAFGGGEA